MSKFKKGDYVQYSHENGEKLILFVNSDGAPVSTILSETRRWKGIVIQGHSYNIGKEIEFYSFRDDNRLCIVNALFIKV